MRPREVPLVRGWKPASMARWTPTRSAALKTGILGEGRSANDDSDSIDTIAFVYRKIFFQSGQGD
jgi:hypothetical protein